MSLPFEPLSLFLASNLEDIFTTQKISTHGNHHNIYHERETMQLSGLGQNTDYDFL